MGPPTVSWPTLADSSADVRARRSTSSRSPCVASTAFGIAVTPPVRSLGFSADVRRRALVHDLALDGHQREADLLALVDAVEEERDRVHLLGFLKTREADSK